MTATDVWGWSVDVDVAVLDLKVPINYVFGTIKILYREDFGTKRRTERRKGGILHN